MDVYRALNADVPPLLLTIVHQANSTIPREEYERTSCALHEDIRSQAQAIKKELQQWLQRQYSRHAEETLQKLQRHALFVAQADLDEGQDLLVQEYQRLGNRISSETLFGLLGSGEVVSSEETPSDPDLAGRIAIGREYLASLGFQPGQAALHESWFLFRGSVHYDILEYMIRDRLGIYQGSYGQHLAYMAYVSFSTYNLTYQIGEGLTADLAQDSATQEISLAFSKGPVQYRSFRQEVAILMEQLAEQSTVFHASLWQQKLGLGTGKEFILRLRIPIGEASLSATIDAIAASGLTAAETIIKQGKLLVGKRIL